MKNIIINLQEEQHIEREATALAEMWFEQATSPDEAARDMWRFVPPIQIPVIIHRKAQQILFIKLKEYEHTRTPRR